MEKSEISTIKIALVLSLFILSTQLYAPHNFLDAKEQFEKIEQYKGKKQNKLFIDMLAMLESSNNWRAYNKYGYIGKWQMGRAALKESGFEKVSFHRFKVNPHIFPEEDQELAIKVYTNINYHRLKVFISVYSGSTMHGVKLTPAGLLAAAHLGGARNVKKFLKSNGAFDPCDKFGTHLSDYMKKFSTYNLYVDKETDSLVF